MERTQTIPQHVALLNECYYAFDFFNAFFEAEIKTKPIINIATTNVKSNATGSKGWFIADKWSNNGAIVPEINLSAEYSNLPHKDVLHTLLHEMAHLKNWENGLSDCNQNYHNAHFKATAEFFGLEVTKTKAHGYSETSLGERALEAIKELKPTKELYVFKRMVGEAKKSNLSQVMVDEETKDMIRELSVAQGMPMKDVVFELVLEAYNLIMLKEEESDEDDEEEEEEKPKKASKKKQEVSKKK